MKALKNLFLSLKTSKTSSETSPEEEAQNFPCKKKNKKCYIGKYRLVSEIGSGKFGTVVLAKDVEIERVYAIKIVLKTSSRIEKLNAEIKILEKLRRHPHRLIVEFYNSFQTNGHVCFVFEFLDGGTIMHQLRSGPFEEDRARFYAACILSAIAHLHSLDIAHKDIKPQNVVLDGEGYAKLVDFGHSQMGITLHTPLRNKLGTRKYKAPEYFESGPAYRFVDFWSLCVTLHLMLTGKHMDSYPQIKIKEKRLTPLAYDLIQRVCVKKPFNRLGSGERGAKELMEHPFFDRINWRDLEKGRLVAPRKRPNRMSISSPNYIFNQVKSVESFVRMEVT